MPRAVVLIGFMGAGKTTVGQALSRRLGWRFEDLDQRIERREQMTVRDIFLQHGEAAFRRAEHAALGEILQELSTSPASVIALGGGAFVSRQNARLLQAANVLTVFLDAEVGELWRRCRQQAALGQSERPLLNTLAEFKKLYQKRRAHYLRASYRQDTDGQTAEVIAGEMIRDLNLQRVGNRRGKKQ